MVEKENTKTGLSGFYLFAGSVSLYMALLGIAAISIGRMETANYLMIWVRLLTPFIQITAAIWLLKNYFKS